MPIRNNTTTKTQSSLYIKTVDSLVLTYVWLMFGLRYIHVTGNRPFARPDLIPVASHVTVASEALTTGKMAAQIVLFLLYCIVSEIDMQKIHK